MTTNCIKSGKALKPLFISPTNPSGIAKVKKQGLQNMFS